MTLDSDTTSNDEAERAAAATAKAPKKEYLRPRDAASLILVDRAARTFRILLGRRASRHAFMPDTYVFPGGRRDRADGRMPVFHDLDAAVSDKLCKRVSGQTSPVRPRALAMAAMRETFEETGLAGTTDSTGRGRADLSKLRFVARAITPPGRPRRYDTRFFAVFADELGIDIDAASDSDELLDLRWVTLDATVSLPLPRITRVIVGDLGRELADHPTLPFGRPVPFYYERGRRRIREIL